MPQIVSLELRENRQQLTYSYRVHNYMHMKRYFDGVELVANLYPQGRNGHNKWRYKNPKSKKFVQLKELMTVAEANQRQYFMR